jgi:hypothetical protein
VQKKMELLRDALTPSVPWNNGSQFLRLNNSNFVTVDPAPNISEW